MDAQSAREIKREDVENNLTFAGFLIISCPLKTDSKSAIKEIVKSSHKVVMITGDNPLTACHVAKELRFTRKTILVLSKDTQSIDDDLKPKYIWISINEDQIEKIDENNWKRLVQNYDLAITGDGLQYLNDYEYKYFKKIAPYITVYARFAPKQKEYIITTLKSLGNIHSILIINSIKAINLNISLYSKGYFTLMCGDGTNDVGALKHANVGVSILSNTAFKKKKSKSDSETPAAPPMSIVGSNANQNRVRGMNDRANALTARERAIARQRDTQVQLQKVLKDMEDDQVQIVKLGDASIAAPFTSKTSSINCGEFLLHFFSNQFTAVMLTANYLLLLINVLFLIINFSMSYNQARSMHTCNYTTNVQNSGFGKNSSI